MARLGEGSSRREGSPGRTESSDVDGYQMVELVRPTPDTKLGLTFGEFRGQVVIHQVFAGYPAEMLNAGDVVHSLNGTPVTAEAAATLLASEAGERLTLRLRPPPGASTVCFAKADAAQEVGIDLRYDPTPNPTPCPTPIPNQVGIELRYDAPSERVCVAGIAADSPAMFPTISPAKGRRRGTSEGRQARAQGGLKVGDLGGGGLRVGDVLLAIDGWRAV